MQAYIIEWLNLFFRCFHVIAGIAWIGASFYFIWLDNSLVEPPQWKKDKGIKGDLTKEKWQKGTLNTKTRVSSSQSITSII